MAEPASSLQASVIIPAYNAEGTLGDCLAALEKQDIGRGKFELIVVDDGSTDGTPEVARKFGVRLLTQPNQGPGAARNYGVREAAAETVLFTDADCIPSCNWVSEMVRPFCSDLDIVGVKGQYVSEQPELTARFVQLEYESKYRRMSKETYIDFVDTYSAGFRKAPFLAIGGYDVRFPTACVEDQELSFRMWEQGYRMVFNPQAIVAHRHVTGLWHYVRKKFRIAYWKVRVLRQHPTKLARDSHTPQSLKVQVLLPFVVVASALAGLVEPKVWLITGMGIACFAVTMAPLLVQCARRDLAVAAAAPIFVAARSVALGLGLLCGVMSGKLSR